MTRQNWRVILLGGLSDLKRLKRATIKEELVKLTGDFKLAVVLNQIIYWSERVRDFDEFIKEEIQRTNDEENELLNGWIYKKAEDLAEETMLSVDRRTMSNYLNALVENGWLETRNNPNKNWDRTKQYRVNLKKIQHDLHKLGYSLEGYKIDLSVLKIPIDVQKIPLERKKKHTRESGNFQAIPEITTEITNNNNLVVEERARVNPFEFYQQNFGIISPHITERITVWLDEKSFEEAEEIIVLAMKIALENNSKSFSYIDAILKNWLEQNVKTLSDANAATVEFKSKKGRKSHGINTISNPGASTDEPEISAEIERRKRLIAKGKNKNNETK